MTLLYRLLEWDKRLFLYLNDKHVGWLDPVMLMLSSSISWVSVLFAVLAGMVYKADTSKKTAALFFMLSVGCNALLNNIIKYVVARPRPIHIDLWKDVLHAIEEYESSYSFFSGHSSNSFCLAVFSLLFFRNKFYTFFIIVWATCVAYSRIYLAKHYPIDVLCGIVFGSMVGFLGYKLFEAYKIRKGLLETQ